MIMMTMTMMIPLAHVCVTPVHSVVAHAKPSVDKATTNVSTTGRLRLLVALHFSHFHVPAKVVNIQVAIDVLRNNLEA